VRLARASLLLAVLVLAGYWVVGVSRKGRGVERLEVSIPAGATAAETAALLKEKGVIPFASLFRAAAKWTGADRRIKPGTYQLRRPMGTLQILRLLSEGSMSGVKVPIPEGFSARQIAERLEVGGVCRGAEFLRQVRAKRLEGYLYPTTYYLEPQAGAEKVIQRMVQEFERRIKAEHEASGPKPKLTLHQLVTLASLVEREAVLAREKPLIAAVYLNRLRLRMRLEADPTVQYALGRWKQGLTTEDLKTPSPYNTYLHYGLPPGPICSPGLDSFRAALSPARTEALYFVADNTGGHVFSTTHEEHQKAKRSFKRGLRAIKERLRREGR